MPQNFIEGCREQGFLLPPDVRDWLAPDHLAWFVIGAVEDMDQNARPPATRQRCNARLGERYIWCAMTPRETPAG